MPGGQKIQGGVLGRSVIVVVNLGIFQEFVVVEAAEELVAGDVVVFLALVVLAGAFGAGGGTDDVGDVEVVLELAGDGALADAGGAAEDDEQAGMFVGAGIGTLFDVLDLFLEPVDRALDFDDVPGDLGVVGLCGDGVGLAEHFLGDEIELPAGVLAGSAGVLESFEMAGEPLDFLADVGALGEDGDFPEQIGLVDLQLGFAEQLVHALGEPLVIIFDHRWGRVSGSRPDRRRSALTCFIRSVKSDCALAGAHGDELGDGGGGQLADDVAVAGDFVGFVARLLADAGELDEAGQIDLDESCRGPATCWSCSR